jgi:type I restriction-modification system DNA methylase subunit
MAYRKQITFLLFLKMADEQTRLPFNRKASFSMEADVKGGIYEGLLSKSAEESPKGAGQYPSPRELIKAIVKVMQPTPEGPRK